MANRTVAQVFKLMMDTNRYHRTGFMCHAIELAFQEEFITAGEYQDCEYAIREFTDGHTMRSCLGSKVLGDIKYWTEMDDLAEEIYLEWDNRDMLVRIAIEVFAH